MPSNTPAEAAFEILPAIHIFKKHAVKPNLEPLSETQEKLVGEFSKNDTPIYVVDFHGMTKNKPNMDLIKKLAEKPIWADCGSRFVENMIDLFVAGAQRVTLRVNKLLSKEELDRCCELSGENLFLGLEKKDGKLQTVFFSDLQDIKNYIEKFGLGGLVLIDCDRAGSLSGIDTNAVKKIIESNISVYCAGGIRDKRDIEFLKESGAAGAITGSAWYNGVIKI